MSSVRTISKNVIYLGVGEVVTKLLLFVLVAYAARSFGKETFGLLSFGLSFALIILIFYDFGAYQMLVREISYNKDKALNYISSSALLKYIVALAVFLISMLLMFLLGFSREALLVSLLMSIYAMLSAFTWIFYSLYRAFERMYYDMLIKIIRMIVLFTTGMFVIIYYKNIFLLIICFIFSELISLIIAMIIAKRKFNFKIYSPFKLLKEDKETVKNIYKKSIPFLLSGLFGGVYLYLGTLILQRIKGEAAAGIYGAAFYIAFATLMFPTIYIAAIYPALSKYFSNSRAKAIIIYKRSFKYLYIIGLPISIGGLMLAAPLINIIYSTGYSESIIVLKIISMFIFLRFLNYLTGTVLSAIDRQNEKMRIQGIVALLNLCLNFVLIFLFSFIGAAIAVLITEILLFLTYYLSVSKYLVKLNLFPVLYKPLIAVGVMALFLFLFSINIFISIIMGALVYGAVLLLLKTFDERDSSFVRVLLRGNNQ